MIITRLLVSLCSLAALLFAFYREAIRRWQPTREDWLGAMSDLGLEPVEGLDGVFAGRVDGFGVNVELYPSASPTTIVTRLAGRGRWASTISIDLVLIARGLAQDPRPRVLTGIAAFDDVVCVRGDDADALGLLDGATRRYLVEMASSRWAVEWGAVRVENGDIILKSSDRAADPGAIHRQVRQAINLARTLNRRGRDQAECLEAGARADVGPMRERCLRLLVERHAGKPITLKACRAALKDRVSSVRIAAACGLGAEGAATLAAIARDRSARPSLRAEALRAWALIEPAPADASTFLAAVLASGHWRVRVEAIHAAGRARCRAVLPMLVNRARDRPRLEALELASALARFDDPMGESALIELLGHRIEDVQLATMGALAEVGRSSAVEPLLPFAKGLLTPVALKRAAREALREIRARLGPADAGRLALVELDEDVGALSEADDATGRVSIDRSARG